MINIISFISVIGISLGTFALIVILSVFNGFESLVVSLFSTFNAELVISPAEGKTFHVSDLSINEIKKISGVAYLTEVVEENALLKYQTKQHIAVVKGVSDDYIKTSRLDTMIVAGQFLLQDQERSYAVIGYGVDYALGVNINDVSTPIVLYVPKRGSTSSLDPMQAFTQKVILPSGVFSIQQDIDTKYIIVPLSFARDLLGYTDELTSIELSLSEGASQNNVQKDLHRILGGRFIVKNRFQQQELLYKVMKSEKLSIFLILSFILLMAMFNVIGSLSVLIIEKKKDIGVLSSLGADHKMIKKIFLAEGMLINILGGIVGLLLGAIVCILQQHYGLIPLKANTFIISSYPVKMELLDFIYIFITVVCIGFVATWYPVKYISKRYFKL